MLSLSVSLIQSKASLAEFTKSILEKLSTKLTILVIAIAQIQQFSIFTRSIYNEAVENFAFKIKALWFDYCMGHNRKSSYKSICHCQWL